jgi:peptidoglycan biosynthesis protein MviN/MurJ (putative lipid II flippase)
LALARPAAAAYAVGLLFLVATNLIRHVAYSYKRYLAYSLVAVGAVVATYAFDRGFAALWSYWGIALARGAVALLWFGAVFAFLARAERLTLEWRVAATAGRALVAAAPMAALVWWLSRLDWGIGGPARLEPFVVAVASAAAGAALYFILMFAMREGEVVALFRSGWARLRKK